MGNQNIQTAQTSQISTEVWSALKNSIFPGAADESICMAVDYCVARKLDVMLKPVHLVPMSVKDARTGQYNLRDVVMPGIGLYRIQADRSGNYAGMSAPTFGPDITETLDGVTVTYPEWCEVSVDKLIGDRIVSFSAREYWLENYATAGRNTSKPNAMWQKRPRGQLVKCTEAQALRKGWPELGAQPTYEEMAGKELDITPSEHRPSLEQRNAPAELPEYSQEKFNKNFQVWVELIASGQKTPDDIINTVSTRGTLTAAQVKKIRAVPQPEEATYANA